MPTPTRAAMLTIVMVSILGIVSVARAEGGGIDAFYVRDALGGKITSPEQIAEVESAMRARLES